MHNLIFEDLLIKIVYLFQPQHRRASFTSSGHAADIPAAVLRSNWHYVAGAPQETRIQFASS